MKKLPILLFLVWCTTMSFAQELSKTDRTKLVDHLKQSQDELFKSIKGLTNEQLHFKASEGAWSIAECVEHMAITEKGIFMMVESALTAEADPSRRSEVQMTDEQILGIIRSRDQKVKTRPEMEPQNNFGNYSETVKAFKQRRKANLSFVKSTDQDLRNRYCQFPFGTIDAYQTILFLSGHVQRHTDQIKEVMAAGKFPS